VRIPVRINPWAFRSALVRRVAARRVYTFMDKLGPERVDWIVANRKPLRELLNTATARWVGMAPRHPWISEAISDQDFIEMLPRWAIQILDQYGDEERTWFHEQLAWMRGIFLDGGLDA